MSVPQRVWVVEQDDGFPDEMPSWLLKRVFKTRELAEGWLRKHLEQYPMLVAQQYRVREFHVHEEV